jgi:hypothetical protein
MSYTPDLEKTQWWHEINFAYSKSIPDKFTATFVGWLGEDVPTSGQVSKALLKKLEWACNNREIDQGCLGEHECEICHNHWDRGEILIKEGETMYVSPKMILHYIRDHGYQPPEEFMNAVGRIDMT